MTNPSTFLDYAEVTTVPANGHDPSLRGFMLMIRLGHDPATYSRRV